MLDDIDERSNGLHGNGLHGSGPILHEVNTWGSMPTQSSQYMGTDYSRTVGKGNSGLGTF